MNLDQQINELSTQLAELNRLKLAHERETANTALAQKQREALEAHQATLRAKLDAWSQTALADEQKRLADAYEQWTDLAPRIEAWMVAAKDLQTEMSAINASISDSAKRLLDSVNTHDWTGTMQDDSQLIQFVVEQVTAMIAPYPIRTGWMNPQVGPVARRTDGIGQELQQYLTQQMNINHQRGKSWTLTDQQMAQNFYEQQRKNGR